MTRLLGWIAKPTREFPFIGVTGKAFVRVILPLLQKLAERVPSLNVALGPNLLPLI